MSKYITSKGGKFKNRDPFTGEDYERLLISGGSGAFRQLLADAKEDPKALFMGTVVVADMSGSILGPGR